MRPIRLLHDYFGLGTQLYKATSSSPDVDVLASATKPLLVNKLATPLTVNVDGTVIIMAGYEMRLL
jgi:hypothetical protein